MEKVLVLGAGGMLGHKLVQTLAGTGAELVCTVHGPASDEPLLRLPHAAAVEVIDRQDVTQLDRLEQLLRQRRPDVVINAVGVIKQRPAAHDAVPSIMINALLPHWLSGLLAEWNGRLIHFSTDCVFNGRRGMYSEADPPDALDLYGRSKALGEVDAPNALTLRTSIIGRELRHGQSLLEWFLRQNNGSVRGFTQAWWSGVTTNHLAQLVAWLIHEWPHLHGVLQVSSGRISKYELLLRIRDAYALNIEVLADDDFVCDRSLDGTRFAQLTGYRFPGWDVLLRELAADPTPYASASVAAQ